MSVTAFALKTNGSGSSASSFNTASVTLDSGKLYVLAVFNENSSAPTRNHAAATGWTEVPSSFIATTDRAVQGVTLLYKEGDGSTGAVTIDFAGQSQSFVNWQMYEITGDGSTWSIVQAVEAGGGTGAPTATFATFADPTGNAALVIATGYTFTPMSVPTNYTQISTATGDLSFVSARKIGVSGSDLSPAFGDPGDNWTFSGIEIQHSGSPPPPTPKGFRDLRLSSNRILNF